MNSAIAIALAVFFGALIQRLVTARRKPTRIAESILKSSGFKVSRARVNERKPQ